MSKVDKKRPMNLDLGTIRLPITSYVSILHRVSGVAMFFAVAVFLWILDTSLASEQGFVTVNTLFENFFAQMIIWACLSALAYHMVMGTRHLVMDAGYGETFESGRLTATIAAVVAALLISLIGGWIFIW
jgi:succinate dehydrogenase / fumarate reductase cytochrome b subunit